MFFFYQQRIACLSLFLCYVCAVSAEHNAQIGNSHVVAVTDIAQA